MTEHTSQHLLDRAGFDRVWLVRDSLVYDETVGTRVIDTHRREAWRALLSDWLARKVGRFLRQPIVRVGWGNTLYAFGQKEDSKQ